ncbi:hypothetical protein [Pseudomonas sp. R151218B TE3479]
MGVPANRTLTTALVGIDREGSMEAAIRRMQEAGAQLIESSAIDGRPFA